MQMPMTVLPSATREIQKHLGHSQTLRVHRRLDKEHKFEHDVAEQRVLDHAAQRCMVCPSKAEPGARPQQLRKKSSCPMVDFK